LTTLSRDVDTRSGLRRLVLGSPESIAGTVYGTIVVMGAITAGAEGVQDLWRLSGIVGATVLVLWLAHVYSHGLGEAIGRGRHLDRAELVSVARREFAIPLAAVAPIVALALGGLGLFRETTALWLALAIGLTTLAAQGLRYAGLRRLDRRGTIKSIILNVSLGLAIVAMKVAVAH
jgi:hypothetical protein